MIVVFGTDGSPNAQHAIREAARLLVLKDAQLFAVAVAAFPPVALDMSPGGLAAASGPLQTALVEQAEKASQEVLVETERLLTSLGLTATSLERLGDPAEELLAVAREVQADVIVVGAHHYNAVQRFLLGSVSDQVSHHAPCSVLVVHLPNEG